MFLILDNPIEWTENFKKLTGNLQEANLEETKKISINLLKFKRGI